MKKLILSGTVFLISIACFAIEGYEMKDETCSNGNSVRMCRYVPDADCSIMEQTLCDDPGVGS